MPPKIKVGQWVRLTQDALPDANLKIDMAARGLVGQITRIDGWLYDWQTGNGLLKTCVYRSEIEAVIYEQ